MAKVYYDDLPPYYSVTMSDGSERATIRARLETQEEREAEQAAASRREAEEKAEAAAAAARHGVAAVMEQEARRLVQRECGAAQSAACMCRRPRKEGWNEIYSILVTHSRVKKRMRAAPFALNRLVSTHGGDVWPSPTVPADCKARLCPTRARGRKPLYTPLERNRASAGQRGRLCSQTRARAGALWCRDSPPSSR